VRRRCRFSALALVNSATMAWSISLVNLVHTGVESASAAQAQRDSKAAQGSGHIAGSPARDQSGAAGHRSSSAIPKKRPASASAPRHPGPQTEALSEITSR